MNRLGGVRVLVTRPKGQTSALVELLVAEGAEPILIPTIEIGPPESWEGLDAAVGRLGEFGWVVFTSANGVRAFAARAGVLGGTEDRWPRIAAVGPATVRAMEEALGRTVDLVPGRFVADGLGEILAPLVAGEEVLLVRAAVAPDSLAERLAAAGARVTVAEAYRNVVPEGSVEALRELFAGVGVEAVTFTSASTAVNLMGLLRGAGLELPEGVARASIGPVTSGKLRELGVPAHVEAEEATVAALVEGLVGWFGR